MIGETNATLWVDTGAHAGATQVAAAMRLAITK
jgi:hypothetical protein